MQKLFSVLVLLTAFSITTNASADIKIATVDIAKVLNNTSEAKLERGKLEKMDKGIRAEIAKKGEDLKTIKNKLEAQAKAKGNIEALKNSSEFKDYAEKAKNYEKLVRDSQKRIRENLVAVNNRLTSKAMDVIKQFASANNIDLVLERSASQKSAVLFADQAADITDKIISKLNS